MPSGSGADTQFRRTTNSAHTLNLPLNPPTPLVAIVCYSHTTVTGKWYQTGACLRWRQVGANDKKCPPRSNPLRQSYNFLGRSGRSSYPAVSQSPQCIGMRLFNVSIKLEDNLCTGPGYMRRAQRQHPSQRPSFNVKVEHLYAKKQKTENRNASLLECPQKPGP